MIKDSDLLNYVYTILNDKRTINNYALTLIRDRDTLEKAGLKEISDFVLKLYREALEKEKGKTIEVSEYFINLIKADADGLLVRLPCKIGDRLNLPEDLYGKYCSVVDIGVKIYACDETTWLSLSELEQEMEA